MSLNGIDISGWQRGINLERVPFDFAIVKATEGVTGKNSIFDSCCEDVLRLNKCLGLYHYANGKDYRAEADNFISKSSKYIGKALLVLDWESQGNLQFGKSDREWVKNWCEYVHSKTGVKPIIYVSKSIRYLFEDLGYEFWIAQYANNNPTGYQDKPWNESAYSCLIRQYTSTGRLNGYNGNLDLDKFYGSVEDWNARAAVGGKTPVVEDKTPSQDLTPVDASVNTESVLNLAAGVMKDQFGKGDERKQKLGDRYDEVQDFINHISSASVDTLVDETKAGKYGNGEIRKIVLGSRYDEVQNKINGESKDSSEYYVVKSGDTLSAIAKKYKTTYKAIAKLNNIEDPDKIYAGQKLRIK